MESLETRCWINARLATMAGDALGVIEDGAVVARGPRIVYAGPAAGAPKGDDTTDCGGSVTTSFAPNAPSDAKRSVVPLNVERYTAVVRRPQPGGSASFGMIVSVADVLISTTTKRGPES